MKNQKLDTYLNFGAKAYRDGEFMEIDEDVKPLYDLGWSPKFSIEDGISEVLKEMSQVLYANNKQTLNKES